MVNFRLAKKILSFGLVIEHNKCYTRDGKDSYYVPYTSNPDFIPAPNQDAVQEYFREFHKLHSVIIPTETCCWTYKIVDVQCDPENPIERSFCQKFSGIDYSEYEEALDAALDEMLIIIQS